MNKIKIIALQKIAEEIENCRLCGVNKTGKAVPGEGSANARVVFVGEAPGKKESETGRPFVGRSGKLLRETIKSIGMKEGDIFITSPVKYLPRYGTPKNNDIEHGKIHLLRQLKIINPKIIVLLGGVACRALLEKDVLIRKVHSRLIEKGNKSYFITYHPAAIIRFPKFKKYFLSDFKRLKKLVKNRRIINKYKNIK